MPYFWSDQAWDEYQYWLSQDKKTVKRVNDLLKEVAREGERPHGKAEILKGTGGASASTRRTGSFTSRRATSFASSHSEATTGRNKSKHKGPVEAKKNVRPILGTSTQQPIDDVHNLGTLLGCAQPEAIRRGHHLGGRAICGWA